MPLVIRRGEEKDFPALLELIRGLAEFEQAPEKVINNLDDMKKEQQHFQFFVADKEGEIIGYALYFFAYYTWVGKSMYLDDIYVKPEYRGDKTGSRLLQKIFEEAKSENCKRLRWAVLDWNQPAIDFYKKVGADITGEWLTCDFHEPGIRSALLNLGETQQE